MRKPLFCRIVATNAASSLPMTHRRFQSRIVAINAALSLSMTHRRYQ
jgi:hypothetical protein